MTYGELKKDLFPEFRKMTKASFVDYCRWVVLDPKERVGGPKGKGRITAKRALILLGERT